mmetsp:Transcript_1108/g.2657  ORF Transcript_1108/g.2657 Transcript_1108/m.2657 type:complete len:238 (+) Transcript_1108:3812-4525(+)
MQSCRSDCGTRRAAGPRASSLERRTSGARWTRLTRGCHAVRRAATMCRPRRFRGTRCARCCARRCTAGAWTTRLTFACCSPSWRSCSSPPRLTSRSRLCGMRARGRSCPPSPYPNCRPGRRSLSGPRRCPPWSPPAGWACQPTLRWCCRSTAALACWTNCGAARMWRPTRWKARTRARARVRVMTAAPSGWLRSPNPPRSGCQTCPRPSEPCKAAARPSRGRWTATSSAISAVWPSC